ncbi:hypothetical protein [Paenibacillus terrigena]|uniref:hypothetical protein n=1 Tax=Paenibacillus terrigena TaxID=369333 RepID=UPI00037A709F|nr:hypothetical protein [Paenibacillus terrigena]
MSIAIDPKAGTHFVGKIFVKPHACDRAVEHFGIDRAAAPMFVMDILRKSSLVSEHVIDEDGKPARMFAYQRTVLIVHPTESTVFTLYPQHKANAVIRNPIEKLIQRVIKSAERNEVREVKRINVNMAELAVERANLGLRLAKTDSNRVIADLNDKISEIDGRIAQLKRDLIDAQREKTNLMKSIAAYV